MFNTSQSSRFLNEHWQKSPVYLPAVMAEGLPTLSPDEVAWLAMQPDVESRLVFTESGEVGPVYRLENGPFDEQKLTGLPDRNWTLLVQDVEKHLVRFRSVVAQVDFLPDWRIDDLMISVAAPGGSVGPHRDHYDVFLCQSRGCRTWQLGDPKDALEDPSSESLALLRPFEPVASHSAVDGDVLYLPPGIPHWGIADSLCVTWSIGMRAPTRRELIMTAERLFDRGSLSDEADQDVFYADPDLDVVEAIPQGIHTSAIDRIRRQNLVDVDLSDIEIATTLGCTVTDPKAWLEPEPLDESTARSLLAGDGKLRLHGMARVSSCRVEGARLHFLNGPCLDTSDVLFREARKVFADRQLSRDEFDRLTADSNGQDLVAWLLQNGLFDAGHDTE